MKKGAFLILVFSLTVFAVKAQLRPQVEIQTSHGSIIIELYHETPLHRDNFLKLVQENIYDSLLFHRVIE
ncbi:MAG TPA: peptidylprolyl isomerase, partial [Algoriphagus sp.]|nr:peptidylprolyl isomerase [Algoriphagus sp.]